MAVFSKSYFGILSIMLITYLATTLIKAPVDSNSGIKDLELPSTIADWHIVDSGRIDSLSFATLGASSSSLKRFANEKGDIIEVTLVHFKNQKFEAQVHSPQQCLPGSGWDIFNIKNQKMKLENGKEFTYTGLNLKKDNSFQKLAYWFSLSGDAVDDEFTLKFEVLKNRLLRRPTSVTFVRLITAYKDGTEGKAQVRIQRFLENAAQYFEKLSLI